MMYHIMLKQQSLNSVSEISFLGKGPQEALKFHFTNVSVVQSSLINANICAWEDQFDNHIRCYLCLYDLFISSLKIVMFE